MTISNDLFLSILSMDPYNRGYPPVIDGLEAVGCAFHCASLPVAPDQLNHPTSPQSLTPRCLYARRDGRKTEERPKQDCRFLPNRPRLTRDFPCRLVPMSYPPKIGQ